MRTMIRTLWYIWAGALLSLVASAVALLLVLCAFHAAKQSQAAEMFAAIVLLVGLCAFHICQYVRDQAVRQAAYEYDHPVSDDKAKDSTAEQQFKIAEEEQKQPTVFHQE